MTEAPASILVPDEEKALSASVDLADARCDQVLLSGCGSDRSLKKRYQRALLRLTSCSFHPAATLDS